MTISAALKETYASGNDEDVVVTTLEVDHASLDESLLFIQNVDSEFGDPGDKISLPIIEGGPKRGHLLAGFSLVPPGFDEDGPTDGKLMVDNVSGYLHDLLKGAVGYDSAIKITFRQYIVSPGEDFSTITGPDDNTYSGLEMLTMELIADQAEGTIAWPDGRHINVPTGPNAFFERDSYPGLFS